MSKPLNHQQFLAGILAHDLFRSGLFFSSTTNVFYCYQPDKGYYKVLQIHEMKRCFLNILLSVFPDQNITDGLVNALLNLAQSYCEDFDPDSESFIAFKDVSLSMEDFKSTVPHSLDSVAILYFDYNLKEVLEAPATRWKQFVEEIFVTATKNDDGTVSYHTDQPLVLLFQAVCGFFLCDPKIDRAYAAFLVGTGHNGKKKITDVLKAIFTKQYITAMTLEQLTTKQFAPANLIGKRLNLCTEEESKYLRGDKFKAMTSGDPIMGEHKHGRSFMFEPRTRFLFSSNEMPTFSGINDGLRRRMVLFPMIRQFKGKNDDPMLSKKLMAELPGIINWMIDGAQFFISENYKLPVESTPSAMAALSEFEQEASSAIRFVIEEGIVAGKKDDPQSKRVPFQLIYNDYVTWCENSGKKPMHKNNFGRDAASYLGEEETPKIDGKTTRVRYIKYTN